MSQIEYDLPRLQITDPGANLFSPEITGGAIEILSRRRVPEPPTCVPEGTECKGGECRPIIECRGRCRARNECLDDLQACVNNLCVCLGDCNDDGIVRGGEIT